jgi:hypothetical protein
MSALGQKQTSGSEIAMSALPPKADIAGRRLDVRFLPIADIPLIPCRCPPGFSPEVRKWGRYLIFDRIGLGKGNGPVQAYLADDHWRDADKK